MNVVLAEVAVIAEMAGLAFSRHGTVLREAKHHAFFRAADAEAMRVSVMFLSWSQCRLLTSLLSSSFLNLSNSLSSLSHHDSLADTYIYIVSADEKRDAKNA